MCSGPYCLQDAGGGFDAQRQVQGAEHAVGVVSCGRPVGNYGIMIGSTSGSVLFVLRQMRSLLGQLGRNLHGVKPGMLSCSLLAMVREPARPPSGGGFAQCKPPLVVNTLQIVNLGTCRSVYAWVYQIYHDVFFTSQHRLSSSFPGWSEGNERPTMISYPSNHEKILKKGITPHVNFFQ